MHRPRTHAFVLALAVTGCYATVTAHPAVYGYDVVYVDTVPPDIEGYPRVYYSGGWAYLVEDHWYYRSAGRWVVFAREPHPLWQYRVHGVPRHIHSPPGPRHHHR